MDQSHAIQKIIDKLEGQISRNGGMRGASQGSQGSLTNTDTTSSQQGPSSPPALDDDLLLFEEVDRHIRDSQALVRNSNMVRMTLGLIFCLSSNAWPDFTKVPGILLSIDFRKPLISYFLWIYTQIRIFLKITIWFFGYYPNFIPLAFFQLLDSINQYLRPILQTGSQPPLEQRREPPIQPTPSAIKPALKQNNSAKPKIGKKVSFSSQS